MSATNFGPTPVRLPITRDLRLVYAFSLATALLMAVTAILGSVFRTDVYPTDATLLFAAPTDLISLVVVLPVVLTSMWLAWRGRLGGLLLWPGALLYVLYINLVYVVGVPFGPLYPCYVVLVALSAYTLIGLTATVDADGVQRRLAGAVPARVSGAILTVLSVLFVAIQVPEVVSAIANGRTMAGLDLAPFVGDVTVLLPMWLAGGWLLWQRKPLGYVGGVALLFIGTTLFAGMGFVLIFSALYGRSAIDWVGVAMMLAMGMVCFVPFMLFLRGTRSTLGPRSA